MHEVWPWWPDTMRPESRTAEEEHMDIEKENPRLMKALAKMRDERTFWQRMDDWPDDHPLISRILGTLVVLLALIAAINLFLDRPWF